MRASRAPSVTATPRPPNPGRRGIPSAFQAGALGLRPFLGPPARPTGLVGAKTRSKAKIETPPVGELGRFMGGNHPGPQASEENGPPETVVPNRPFPLDSRADSLPTETAGSPTPSPLAAFSRREHTNHPRLLPAENSGPPNPPLIDPLYRKPAPTFPPPCHAGGVTNTSLPSPPAKAQRNAESEAWRCRRLRGKALH